MGSLVQGGLSQPCLEQNLKQKGFSIAGKDQLKTQKPDDGRCLAERARLRGQAWRLEWVLGKKNGMGSAHGYGTNRHHQGRIGARLSGKLCFAESMPPRLCHHQMRMLCAVSPSRSFKEEYQPTNAYTRYERERTMILHLVSAKLYSCFRNDPWLLSGGRLCLPRKKPGKLFPAVSAREAFCLKRGLRHCYMLMPVRCEATPDGDAKSTEQRKSVQPSVWGVGALQTQGVATSPRDCSTSPVMKVPLISSW